MGKAQNLPGKLLQIDIQSLAVCKAPSLPIIHCRAVDHWEAGCCAYIQSQYVNVQQCTHDELCALSSACCLPTKMHRRHPSNATSGTQDFYSQCTALPPFSPVACQPQRTDDTRQMHPAAKNPLTHDELCALCLLLRDLLCLHRCCVLLLKQHFVLFHIWFRLFV
jgi:hypothetical protein